MIDQDTSYDIIKSVVDCIVKRMPKEQKGTHTEDVKDSKTDSQWYKLNRRS